MSKKNAIEMEKKKYFCFASIRFSQVIKVETKTTLTLPGERKHIQTIEFWLSYFFRTSSLTVQVIWQEKGKIKDQQIRNYNAVNNDRKATTTVVIS